MRKKLLFLCVVLLSGLGMMAQTDVTSTYLTNAGFDKSSDWVTADQSANKTVGNIDGWTFNGGSDWYYTATFEVGGGLKLNGATAPATNSENKKEGGVLGLSVGWGNTCSVKSSDITLPVGTYKISYAAYNAGTATQANNKFGFVTSSKSYLGTKKSFTLNAWTTEEIEVVLAEETTGYIQVGIQAVSGGSGSNAKLFVDYVKITKIESIDTDALSAKISTVQAVVDNSTGDKTAINAAIATATSIKNNPESQAQANQAVTDLNTAYETYVKSGAMPNSGYTFDMTFTITNPSFETGNYSGWTTTTSNDTGAKLNSNATYTMSGVDGSYVFNTWSVGTAITQKVTGLPAGVYTLSCVMATDAGKTFSLKGNDTEGTASSTDKGTGVEVTTENIPVTNGELTISAGTSDKYWYKADNFQLKLVRALTKDDFPAYTLAAGAMNKDVAAAQMQAESTYTSNVTLANYNALTEAIKTANASVQAYANIKAYYDMTSAKVSGDYTSYTTDYEAGNYTTEAEGIAAIKAIRNGIATTSMTANADLTSLIDNPGFELGNTNYWNVKASSDTGAKDANSDTYKMSGSEGNYLFNTWWQGTPLTQNLGKLPVGTYQLSATVASDGGTVYYLINGQPNSWVETSKDGKAVGITGTSTFTLSEETEVTIGIVGGAQGTAGAHKDYTADGYWFYKADDFKLTYLGATAPENTIDGVYTLTVDGITFLSRGGDSGTEAVTSADNPLAVKITTVSAGIQTIQFMDTKGYMMWNGEMVYTDGTMEPKKETHLSYWKVEKAAGENNYTILNTQSGGYLVMENATRDGNEINVATLDGSPESWGLAKLDEKQLAAAQDMIDLANATTIPADESEIGDGVFQYSADNIGGADMYISSLKGQSAVALVKMCEGEDFVQDKAEMTEAVNTMLTLNAPSATQAYKIILKSDGWTYNNCAITSMNNRDGQGGYNLQYKVQNPNYAQAMYFTPVTVEGKLNTYTISFTDADGQTRYVSTGVPYSGNTSQIRTTTTADDVLVVEVRRNGEYIQLYNTAANKFIGSQDAGVYTVGSHNDFIVAETTAQNAITKTVADGKYATVVLPYDAEGTAYEASIAEGGKAVTLTEVSKLEANKAYILGAGTYNFSGVNIAYAEPAANGVLTGVYTATKLAAGDYVMQTKDGVQKFYKVAEDSEPTLTANKAYIKSANANAGVKALGIALEGDETAIQALEALTNGTAKIYDLNGRQLQKLQKGINIVNGKRILVK